jgi:hypothetical protein
MKKLFIIGFCAIGFAAHAHGITPKLKKNKMAKKDDPVPCTVSVAVPIPTSYDCPFNNDGPYTATPIGTASATSYESCEDAYNHAYDQAYRTAKAQSDAYLSLWIDECTSQGNQ